MIQDTKNDMKLVNVNVNQMQVFVIINNVGIILNADVNVKNRLTKEHVIKDLSRILTTANVNGINHVVLEDIKIIKTVNL